MEDSPMNTEEAQKVIFDNDNCNENSFIYYLHEECYFSIEKFWEFYDSIVTLIGKKKNPEITKRITQIYQRILKEMIYHFDPMDIAVMDNFPENYTDYIERIDFALLAYYTDNIDLVDDGKFSLQK